MSWETTEHQPLAPGCFYCGAELTYHDRVENPVHALWFPADKRVPVEWCHERCLPKVSFSGYAPVADR